VTGETTARTKGGARAAWALAILSCLISAVGASKGVFLFLRCWPAPSMTREQASGHLRRSFYRVAVAR
jgi:hypothetical protein